MSNLIERKTLQQIEPEVTTAEANFREDGYNDVEKLRTDFRSKLVCQNCDKEKLYTDIVKRYELHLHPFLGIILCFNCKEFIAGPDAYSMDEDSKCDKYCRWCGDGGKLILCDKCTAAFCKKCVKKVHTKEEVEGIVDTDWECFLCDHSPLYERRAVAALAEKYIEANKKEDNEKKKEKPGPRSKKSKTPIKEKSDDDDDEDDKEDEDEYVAKKAPVQRKRQRAGPKSSKTPRKSVRASASRGDDEIVELSPAVDSDDEAVEEVKKKSKPRIGPKSKIAPKMANGDASSDKEDEEKDEKKEDTPPKTKPGPKSRTAGPKSKTSVENKPGPASKKRSLAAEKANSDDDDAKDESKKRKVSGKQSDSDDSEADSKKGSRNRKTKNQRRAASRQTKCSDSDDSD